MRTRIPVAVAAALLALVALRAQADGPLETACNRWLALLDDGRFDAAWQEGGDLLREGVTQASWVEATKRVRRSFGPISSRDVMTKDYHTQIDGGPNGTYFTLRIHTRFADGRDAVEIVTVSPGPDQVYRVVAYGTKR